MSVFRPGRPPTLSDAEDASLLAYIAHLDNLGAYPTVQQVVQAANTLRDSRKPKSGPVSKNWCSRWIKQHPELRSSRQRPVEAGRLGLEQQIELVEAWYRRLDEQAKYRQSSASTCWNADKCGARIGCRDGRIRVVMVAKQHHERPRTLDPNNRESCTLMGGGNASGDSLPPFCVFEKWPTNDWLDFNLDENIKFVRSDTGFSNAELMLTWLRHFNEHSWPKAAEVRSLGSPSLEEWFGYSADTRFDFLMDDFDQAVEPETKRGQHGSRIWRWLILDGFSGHFTIEIVDYCLRFDIELVFLPSHSTHLMQPMDVGVFSHFKRELQYVLQEHIQRGFPIFTRSDFVRSLQVS